MIEVSKCQICDKPLPYQKIGRKRKYCSTKCKEDNDNKKYHQGIGTITKLSGYSHRPGESGSANYGGYSNYELLSESCRLNLHNTCSGKKTHNIPCQCLCHGYKRRLI